MVNALVGVVEGMASVRQTTSDFGRVSASMIETGRVGWAEESATVTAIVRDSYEALEKANASKRVSGRVSFWAVEMESVSRRASDLASSVAETESESMRESERGPYPCATVEGARGSGSKRENGHVGVAGAVSGCGHRWACRDRDVRSPCQTRYGCVAALP